MAKVRFLAHGREHEVEVPLGTTILAASKLAHAPEGDACGGVCAFPTPARALNPSSSVQKLRRNRP